MKSNMKSKKSELRERAEKDHAEGEIIHDKLLLRARTLAGALQAATGKIIAEPSLVSKRSDKWIAPVMCDEIDALEAHCDLLQREITASCQQQPASAGSSGSATKKPTTVDEKLLAARGVSSYAELTEKRQKGQITIRNGD